ncbi:MAG: helix-turn-helix transcriptional regulator [Acidobacteriota bacterium]
MPKKEKNDSFKINGSGSRKRVSENRDSENRVRQLREERKWTQWQLAKISRLSERTIQRIEGGQRIGITAEMALASAFEVNVADLYESAASSVAVDFIFLKRIVSGTLLLDMIESADAARLDSVEVKEDQVELVSDFLQSLKVWSGLCRDSEPGERVKVCHIFSRRIEELAKEGLWVFGTCQRGIIDSIRDEKLVAQVKVVRFDDPRIIQPHLLSQVSKEMCGLITTA